MTKRSETQRGLDKIYLGQLPIICLVVSVYYGLITVAHLALLPAEIVLPIAVTSSIASIAPAILFILLKQGKIRAQHSNRAFVPIALLVLTTVYTHIFLAEDQHQLTNAILVAFAFGLVTMSQRVFLLLSIVSTAAYISALMVLEGPYSVHYGFMLFASLTLSILGFLIRYRALHRSTRLLIGNRKKTRTLAASTREIKKRMAEAEEANAARDIFLANITHELRTPMTGILGMLELVDETDLNKDQKFMIGTAQKSANYLLHIVNDLLDLSKLEANKLELKFEPVDVATLTRDAVASFKGTALKKQLDLNCVISDSYSALVSADGARLSQILLNLISNAVKFTAEGSVTVNLQHLPNGSSQWQITDTGPGIPAEKQENLFKRFEQLDASLTRETTGSGLGLAIVHELTELFGGTVTVDSTEGAGTTFTVIMPLEKVAAPARKAPSPEASSGNHMSLSHLKLRVLAAEDNDVNQILLTKILARLGVELTLVSNGQLAVDTVSSEAEPFDLIFMDVQMPVMDGVTATRLIRQALSDPPPIIAITANTADTDIEAYTAAGMTDFIGKPINLENFYDVILRNAPKQ